MEPFLPPEPADKWSADKDFDIGSGFVEQSCGFQGALASANDNDLFLGKAAEVAVIARMRSQFARNVLELFRAPGEGHNSGSDNYAAGFPDFAVFGGETEVSTVFFYALYFSGVGIRRRLGLKPPAVVNEAIQRQGGSNGVSSGGLVAL